MFIYQIRNLTNNKKYYGKTNNFKRRKSTHITELNKGTHHCIFLQRAWNKYGSDNFVFEIIKDDLTEEEASEFEYNIINETYDENYNTSRYSDGGDLISYNPNRDSIVEKISKAVKSRFEDNELRKRYSDMFSEKNNPMFGRHHDEKTRQKMRQNHGEIKDKDTWRKNLSKAEKKRYEYKKERELQSERLKKHHKDHPETAKKISKSMKERAKDEQYKINVKNGICKAIESGESDTTTRIMCDGKEFYSIKNAVDELNISSYKIKKILSDPLEKEWYYIDEKKTLNKEQKIKIAEKNRGKKRTKESKRKISLGNQIYYYVVNLPNGEKIRFDLVKDMYEYFKKEYNVSEHTISNLSTSGEKWKPKKHIHKILENMFIEKIKK